MKKLYSLIVALLILVTLMGQAPESFKYQAVLRNARGDIKASTASVIGIDILKGSATGIKVYSETHNVTTDSYGLINLEIGNGTSTLGTFSDVNWSAGSYFLKLIVDGNVMGTAQLLSVPYALYAKSSGNEISNFDFTSAASGDILQFNGTKWVKLTPNYATSSHTHSDATTTASGFMSGADKTKLDGMQNANGSETKVTAGTNVTVTGTGTTSAPYVINASATGTAHYIGENYGGGIVFYVYDNGQHGLIAAPEDNSVFNGGGYDTYFPWEYGYPNYTGASGDGLGSGIMNTALAIATQIGNDASGNFAARVSTDYKSTMNDITYGGWYLPSIYELNLLYKQKSVIGNLSEDIYWSSTEYQYSYTYFQNFIDGNISYDYDSYYDTFFDKSTYFLVRAIRAF
jgi:hypothetical protein